MSVLLAFFFGGFALLAKTLPHPYNLDFEDVSPSGAPKGWMLTPLSKNLEYTAKADFSKVKSGKYSYRISKGGFVEEDNGSLLQKIDASRYRGETVRFGAAIQCEPLTPVSAAYLYVKQEYSEAEDDYDIDVSDPGVESPEWIYVELETEISEDAREIAFGLILTASGTARIDDVSFEIVESDTNFAPTKASTDRGLNNLSAFAKLYSAIRYFYPGNETAEIDWTSFLLSSVEEIEAAGSDEELLASIKKYFEPVAPGIEFTKNATRETKSNSAPENSLPEIALTWKRLGPPSDVNPRFFTHERVNVFASQREAEGILMQIVNAEDLRGQSIVFSAKARGDFEPPTGRAELWIRIDKNEKPIVLERTGAGEIENGKISEPKIQTTVPEDAEIIRLGLVMHGEGSVVFDEARLYDAANPSENLARNPNFEDIRAGANPASWMTPEFSTRAGYDLAVSPDPIEGVNSIEIKSDKLGKVEVPLPGERYVVNVTSEIKAIVPKTVFVDSTGTLPRPKSEVESIIKFDYSTSVEDRRSRIAALIAAYALLDNFDESARNRMTKDRKPSLLEELKKSLKIAAPANNPKDFDDALFALFAISEEAQTGVWSGEREDIYALGFLWKKIDDGVYVTKSAIPEISLGDEILEIDGRAASTVLYEASELFAGRSRDRKNLAGLAKLRLGERDSEMNLKIKKRKSGEKVDLTARRDMFAKDLVEVRPPEFGEIEPGIFYMDPGAIDDRRLKEEISSLRAAKKIIIDCRGLCNISEHFFGFFIDEPIVGSTSALPIRTEYEAPPSYIRETRTIAPFGEKIDAEIAILVDARTISYSEAFAEVAQRNGLATLVGRPTAGSPGDPTTMNLPCGYSCTLVAVPAFDSKGNKLTGPIEPDVLVELDPEKIDPNTDPILDKALKILRER